MTRYAFMAGTAVLLAASIFLRFVAAPWEWEKLVDTASAVVNFLNFVFWWRHPLARIVDRR